MRKCWTQENLSDSDPILSRGTKYPTGPFLAKKGGPETIKFLHVPSWSNIDGIKTSGSPIP